MNGSPRLPFIALGLFVGVSGLAATGHAQIRPRDLPIPAVRRTTEDMLADKRTSLLEAFEKRLANPPAYAASVRRECRGFPEWDLFPYVLPAYAYTSLAIDGTVEPTKARQRIATLIDLAAPAVARNTTAPGGDLMRLRHHRDATTYLSHLNLAMACFKRVGGDERYDKLHDHLTRLLHEALVERKGSYLRTTPWNDWPFETVPAMLSLYMVDQRNGESEHAKVIADHIAWLREHACESGSGLPFSFIDPRTGRTDPPRGCALSWRVQLTAHFDREEARRLYDAYCARYWVEQAELSGFREWPASAGQRRADPDSGPILFGVGGSATALGLGTAIAMDDEARLRTMLSQLDAMPMLLPLLAKRDPRDGKKRIAGMIEYDPRYLSGFLYGDCTLFHALTWTDWSGKPIE